MSAGNASRPIGAAPPALRRRLLALIHQGATQLGMDEDTRRALQVRITGHASCADMSTRQLDMVLDALASLGWSPRRPIRASQDRVALLGKLQAQAAAQGYPHPDYVMGISRRMFGALAPNRLEWHSPRQLGKLVAALAYDQKRHPKGKKACT